MFDELPTDCIQEICRWMPDTTFGMLTVTTKKSITYKHLKPVRMLVSITRAIKNDYNFRAVIVTSTQEYQLAASGCYDEIEGKFREWVGLSKMPKLTSLIYNCSDTIILKHGRNLRKLEFGAALDHTIPEFDGLTNLETLVISRWKTRLSADSGWNLSPLINLQYLGVREIPNQDTFIGPNRIIPNKVVPHTLPYGPLDRCDIAKLFSKNVKGKVEFMCDSEYKDVRCIKWIDLSRNTLFKFACKACSTVKSVRFIDLDDRFICLDCKYK